MLVWYKECMLFMIRWLWDYWSRVCCEFSSHDFVGVVLSREELCQLQYPGMPYSMRGNVCRCGLGLLTAHNLTDLPMAISGMSAF